MTKKILAIILAALLIMSFAACTENNGEEGNTSDNRIDINGSDDGTGSGETGDPIDGTDNNEAPAELDYTSETGKVYILHENGAVNLRNGDGTIYKSFSNGTEFDKIAVSTDGEWVKVAVVEDGESKEYYVVSSCVTDLKDVNAGFTAVSKTLKLDTEGLTIRIAPNKNNRPVGYYSEGDEVKVIAENAELGWYKVEFTAYGGATAYGFVASDADFYEAQTEESSSVESESNT